MAKFILYTDSLGNYRWRLKAANGDIIADSAEGYVASAGAKDGIAFVRKYAEGADFEDRT